jgi:acetyl coenzyme A synthetase (ADP forming)-like protein
MAPLVQRCGMDRAAAPGMARSSLDAVLSPASVAVIGASRSRAHVGGEIFANLIRRPFAGPVYPVHASATHVQGVRAYKSIGDVPEAVDLAIIAVPAKDTVGLIRVCADAGVKAAVVITAGFGELGAEGQRAQSQMIATARETGMRIVGPNCLGVLNTDPDVLLHATFATGWPPRGNVSIASQSGALGVALLDEANEHGIGIRQFVSLGNEADVSPEDLLEHWEHDPETRVILLYLESLREPRRFLEVARRVTRAKPVVAVKSGRSPAGARAAGSHTGALATRDVVVDALLAQAGVVRVGRLEALFDTATLLSAGRFPAGRRVGIVTNAGGPGILAADACAAHGLSVPPLADGTRREVLAVVPEASAGNPVDLVASATSKAYADVLPTILRDPNIDSLIVTCVPTNNADAREVAQVVARVWAGSRKPMAACILGTKGVHEARAILQQAQIPVYALPESAPTAMAAAATHAEGAGRKYSESSLSPLDAAGVRARIARGDGTDGVRWLRPDELTPLFDAYGIRCLASAVAKDADGAARAASSLGYPVAVKVMSSTVHHKSDIGGVLLGLRSETEVRDGVVTLERRMEAAGHGGQLEGFFVQAMAPRGVEMFVGGSRDGLFGPIVAFGTGGVELELWNDVVLRLAPIGLEEARRMLDSIRGRALLDGFRGAPRADRDALVDAIQRVSRLMEDVPEVLELDLNPLVALPPGQGVVAVDARVRVTVRSRGSETGTPA